MNNFQLITSYFWGGQYKKGPGVKKQKHAATDDIARSMVWILQMKEQEDELFQLRAMFSSARVQAPQVRSFSTLLGRVKLFTGSSRAELH